MPGAGQRRHVPGRRAARASAVEVGNRDGRPGQAGDVAVVLLADFAASAVDGAVGLHAKTAGADRHRRIDIEAGQVGTGLIAVIRADPAGGDRARIAACALLPGSVPENVTPLASASGCSSSAPELGAGRVGSRITPSDPLNVATTI